MTEKIHLASTARTTEPAWSSKVDRWYQLDEICYSFCEGLNAWNYLQDLEKPDAVILAMDGASNLADFDFVNSGAHSPAKFVYTLPNICAAVIFQMIGWSGKVYCFHQGQNTLEFSLQEAKEMASSGKKIWVFASSPLLKDNTSREVRFYSF